MTCLTIFRAIEYHDLEATKALIEKKVVGVNYSSDNDFSYIGSGSLLAHAIRAHSKKIVEYLIKHGADVKYKDEYGVTLLMIAAGVGNLDAVKFLIKHGVKINGVDRFNRTALYFALQGQWLEISKILIENGGVLHEKRLFDIDKWCKINTREKTDRRWFWTFLKFLGIS